MAAMKLRLSSVTTLNRIAGRHLEFLEIDAASRTGVDDMRELIENVQYKPSNGLYKIYLIDEVLKKEMKFKGFVVSDWAAIDEIDKDYKKSIIQAVNAGIDMVMVPGQFI